MIGFCVNFITEALYRYVPSAYAQANLRRHKDKRGVEARLYTPMAAGISFTVGCLIFAFTSVPEAHWMGACVGAVIIISESRSLSLEFSNGSEHHDDLYLLFHIVSILPLRCPTLVEVSR